MKEIRTLARPAWAWESATGVKSTTTAAGENEGGPYPGTSGVGVGDGREVDNDGVPGLPCWRGATLVRQSREEGGWSAVAGRGGAHHQAEAYRAELQHRGVGGVVALSGGGTTSGREEGSRRTGSSAGGRGALCGVGAAEVGGDEEKRLEASGPGDGQGEDREGWGG